ncbi:MAG: tRNA (adenine(22)-N(1))-methyltransferase [Cellulosilyticaceae bacterium]
MQLSKRLNAIASFVPPYTRVVDVGTDHGYIPIYLTMNNLCTYCIASDINKGPLESAKRHMLQQGINTIDLRQGSGLSTVSEEDALEACIIAGMGGLLINNILENDLNVVKGLKRLILQPQNNIPDVRRFLHMNNFKIIKEKFLKDDGKYYTILCAEKGQEKYEKEYEYKYGKYLLENTTPEYIEWLQYKENVFKKIEEQLKHADLETIEKRKKMLEEDYNQYKEALKCIQ